MKMVEIPATGNVVEMELETFFDAITLGGKVPVDVMSRDAMRRAFYAGVSAGVGMVNAAMDTAVQLPDDQGGEVIQAVFDRVKEALAQFSAEQRALASKLGAKTTRVEAGDGILFAGVRNKEPI